jgi:hypothetical protein
MHFRYLITGIHLSPRAMLPVALLIALACDPSPAVVPAPPPASAPTSSTITITPAALTLVQGASGELTVTVSGGNPKPFVADCRSSDATIVTTALNGSNCALTGVRPGSGIITASAGALSTSAVVTVVPRPTVVDTAPVVPSTSVLSPTTVRIHPTLGDSLVLLADSTYGVRLGGDDQWRYAGGTVSSRVGAVQATWDASGDSMVVRTGNGPATDSLSIISGTRRRASPVWVLAPSGIRDLRIAGAPDTLRVGDSATVQLMVDTDRFGVLGTRTGTWSVNDASIGGLDGNRIVARSGGPLLLSVARLGRTATKALFIRGAATAGNIVGLPSVVALGSQTRVTASFRDARGAPIACRTLSWTVAPPVVASIAPTENGAALISALSTGSASVLARCDGSGEALASFTVTSAIAPTAPGIALRIDRIDSTGSASQLFVSAGLPMAPGRMRTADVAGLRLTVGGTEIGRHASALQGTHPDGSLRSILLQFTVPIASVGAPVRLEFAGRTIDPLPMRPPPSEPSTIVRYENLSDLIATGIVGSTMPRALSPQSPAFFRTYEQRFDQFEPIHSAASDPAYSQNYYDRVLAQYGFWARTGNPALFARASRLARRYRNEYIIPERYGLPEWQAGIDGIAVHYWLTGDDSSRNTILLVASSMETYRGSTQMFRDSTHVWMDARIYARVLMTKVLAHMMGATSLPANPIAIPDLRQAARTDLNDILAMQHPDGTWRFSSHCYETSNFMIGLLIGVLGQYFDQFEGDARIRPAVRRTVDFLFSTQWRSADLSFNYYSGPCRNEPGLVKSPDLNGLFLDGIGWLHRMTRDPLLRARGDSLFHGTATDAAVYLGKQFNQSYQMSFRWLGAR